MSYQLDIEIPVLPKTVNSMSKKSFWARKNENKKWDKHIFVYSYGKAPCEPLTKCDVTLTRVSSKEPDTDGLYSSFKSVLDALIHNNIIIDDKPSVINLKCLWEKGPPNKGAVKIRIEDRS